MSTDPSVPPDYPLTADLPLAAEALRYWAGLLLASGEVDGTYIERVYARADVFAEWAAEHGTRELPSPPVLDVAEEE